MSSSTTICDANVAAPLVYHTLSFTGVSLLSDKLLLATVLLYNAHNAPDAIHKPFQRDSCIADSEEAWLCSMACLACIVSQCDHCRAFSVMQPSAVYELQASLIVHEVWDRREML